MSWWGEVLVGLVIAVGLVGIVLPVLPGVLLIAAAIAVWAYAESSAAGWTVLAVCLALLVVSGVVKYAWPGRRMSRAGVPTRTIVIGALVGIVGFFVIPVVGLFLGFVAGAWAAESVRLRDRAAAWTSTVEATKAVGLSILVELAGALAASAVWLIAAVVV